MTAARRLKQNVILQLIDAKGKGLVEHLAYYHSNDPLNKVMAWQPPVDSIQAVHVGFSDAVALDTVELLREHINTYYHKRAYAYRSGSNLTIEFLVR
jgi:hypothetical protein